MDKRIFSELLESVAEMGRISRGEIPDARVIELSEERHEELSVEPAPPPDGSGSP
jgi:hypothetical protein